jgi:hypothetical protein
MIDGGGTPPPAHIHRRHGAYASLYTSSIHVCHWSGGATHFRRRGGVLFKQVKKKMMVHPLRTPTQTTQRPTRSTCEMNHHPSNTINIKLWYERWRWWWRRRYVVATKLRSSAYKYAQWMFLLLNWSRIGGRGRTNIVVVLLEYNMEWRKPAVDHVMNMIAFVLLGEAYNNQPQNLKYTNNKLLVHNVDRVECIMWTECGVWNNYTVSMSRVGMYRKNMRVHWEGGSDIQWKEELLSVRCMIVCWYYDVSITNIHAHQTMWCLMLEAM